MARKVPGWVIGCGIGCGAIIVLVVAVGLGSFFYLRNVVQEFEGADAVSDQVTASFGRIDEFVPNPTGEIPADRVEAFLEVRRIAAPARMTMEESLSVLAESEEEGWSLSRTLPAIRAGFGLLTEMAGFFRSRNEAMLSAGMGPGEYGFIYAVAYFSFLERSPADGPPFILEEGREERGLTPGRVAAMRMDATRNRLHGRLLSMLRRQLEAANEMDGRDLAGGWREALSEEVAAMEAEDLRLPWEEGLPAVIETSLEPYRDRLSESYSALCNPLETNFHGD
jgi:hypothetical protein